MTLVRCTACKAKISNAAVSCPKCGHPRPDGGWPKPPNVLGWGVALVLAAYFASKIFGIEGPPRAAAPVAVQKPAAPVAVVSNSAWDGSVYQVERYLKTNLKDPDSFEAVAWDPVVTVNNGTGYVSRVRYRAKNSFGGYIIETQLFFLDRNGNVVSVAKDK